MKSDKLNGLAIPIFRDNHFDISLLVVEFIKITMNIIRYQFAEPEEILSLDNSTFELLLHEKIYRVNKRFV